MMRTLSRTLFCAWLGLFAVEAAAAPEQFHRRAHQLQHEAADESDIQAEIRFGRDIAARILGRLQIESPESPRHRYVNLVGRSLAGFANRPELEFRFAIVRSEAITAYSTPGGYVFVTSAALDAMTDEAELAAVLAHEIAHVSARHIVKAFNIRGNDDAALSGVARLVGAGQDTGRVAFFQAVDNAVKLLFETGYRHQDELEADRLALMLLAASGYDPQALPRFLQRAQALSQDPVHVSSSHPATAQRLSAIAQFMEEEGLSALTGSHATQRFQQHVQTL